MGTEWLEIIAPGREQAERLAELIGVDFEVEVRSDDTHVVRVTPDSETTEKLVSLFNSVGRWLSEGGLSSCDVRFGERSLTVLAATAEELGDPTSFLVERARQLEHALTSRVVIEQAKGVLAERRGTTVEEAFETLRRTARNGGRLLHEVAAEVVRGELDPE